MKTLSIISLLFLLANCAGGQMSSMKFGKRCTVSDINHLQETYLTLSILLSMPTLTMMYYTDLFMRENTQLVL